MNAQLKCPDDLAEVVTRALAEDRTDNVPGATLIATDSRSCATLLAHENALLAGSAWFDAVFRTLDADINIDWNYVDGQRIAAGARLCTLRGATRTLLGGKRTALNFLQMLSGVASATYAYVERLKGTQTAIVATRATLPGLRSAQQYAVCCGGGVNPYCGQPAAIVLDSSHIAATTGIAGAVSHAREAQPELAIQVCITTLEALDTALEADVDAVALDNLATHMLTRAANMVHAHNRRFRTHIAIEASGDINLRNVREVADTGVDRIAIAGLTNQIRPTALSLQIAPL